MRRILLGLVMFGLIGCVGTHRAVVHPEDQAKVFPWPSGKDALVVRVKPRGKALAEFQELKVSPETTFYVTDELGTQFAYTPKRSPIRRLAPVQTIEIRWPPPAEEAPAPPVEGTPAPAEGTPAPAEGAPPAGQAPDKAQPSTP
jgi:hypothetical protein